MSQKYFTQGQAIDYIEKVFGDGEPSNGGKNFSVVCPMCRQFKGSSYSKQKLVIRTDNFWVHCWVVPYSYFHEVGPEIKKTQTEWDIPNNKQGK